MDSKMKFQIQHAKENLIDLDELELINYENESNNELVKRSA